MHLKQAIALIMAGAAPRHAVEVLVDQSHRFACAYLKHKVAHGRLQPEHFGLSLDDLALDCVAELFRRDDAGRLVHLVDYFTSTAWERKSNETLHITLRRLVFSKVNEELFRRYRNHDPALSRLIRNVKNAVKETAGWSLVRYGSVLWMVADEAVHREGQPTVPPEILEAHLVPHVRASKAMPDIVASFVELIQGHRLYRPAYPVTQFAQVVQQALKRLAHAPDDTHREEMFREEEVARAIAQAVRDVRTRMYDTYVGQGKLDADTFELYVRVTHDILQDQFKDSSLPPRSYFDVCHAHRPGLSKATYRQVHRHIVEYLVKQARDALIAYLRQDLQRSNELS